MFNILKCLGSVRDAFGACHARAVGAAVEMAVSLDAVPDHLDVALLAGVGEGVDRALEAVKGARSFPRHTYLEGLIVLISTYFTLGHLDSPFPRRGDALFRR
jgi:hypothetical protein